MATGIIKTIVAEKGFGFIKPDAGGDDVFFHNSEFDGDFGGLSQGQKVEYTDGMGDKGPKATGVKVVD